VGLGILGERLSGGGERGYPQRRGAWKVDLGSKPKYHNTI